MGLFSWILFGMLAGLVARAITPGRQAAGCLPTLAVGIVGAMIGGVGGEAILERDVRFAWDLGPFLLAVLGAVVLLLALEALGRGGRRRL
ncbi:MAG: GlsB/YeaQ/YmgE family stress response membrane protein [Actinobacteria bacterium]|nr:GlsB/YeaQ/YmgE family stress response membrane protein [Actinomycetota bacterium]